MTAEVAILNRSAVALAADSTVTINHSGSKKNQKTYNTVNKLFRLSRRNPVGVMIYGNADLLGIPWETIIKKYRAQLGDRSFKTVSEYADDLIAFLEAKPSIFPAELQAVHFGVCARSYFSTVIKPEIKTAVEKRAPAGTSLTKSQISKIASGVIVDHWRKMESAHPLLAYLSPSFADKLVKAYASEIKEAREKSFPEVDFSAAAKKCVRQIAGRLIAGDLFPSTLTGVVVAGFGDDELFPSLRTFSPHLVVLGKLIFKDEKGQSYRVGFTKAAALIPFAQRDVVSTFLNGIDGSYLELVTAGLSQLFDKHQQAILDSVGTGDAAARAGLADKLTEASKEARESFLASLNLHLKKKHIDPLLDVIGVLPKDELAAMAEALVNLTSVKRKMSLELETVGGPIDVAVISKGDGFIWISRKHYFRQELNPRFRDRYKEK